MGGYTECFPCPAGWLCSEGVTVPCGYGSTMTSVATAVQEDEGSSSSALGVYGGRCTYCPAGNACPGGGVVEECLPGMFSPGGNASIICRPCEPGTFASSNGSEQCQLCSAGEDLGGGRKYGGCRSGVVYCYRDSQQQQQYGEGLHMAYNSVQ